MAEDSGSNEVKIHNSRTDPFAVPYGYQPNSFRLIETVTGPVHTVTNLWEPDRNVLDLKRNELAGGTQVSVYDYTVNDIGQRTAVAQSGSAFPASSQIDWDYDSYGQLSSADHSETAKARAYAYDSIGNRLSSQKSDSQIANPPTAGTTTYTPNPLNQYGTVTVGTAGPAVSPSHDEDGNATAYPLPTVAGTNATLSWDAENRLVKVETPNNATISYQYDYLSRRITRQEQANGLTSSRQYLYNGWNCVAEYDSLFSNPAFLSKTYLWGLDLSGSMQGAGGVGGLLVQNEHNPSDPSQITSYYPTYDGNGNVSEYLDAGGAVVEHNQYDPFGNLTTGGTVTTFTYRFSTKPIDNVTGLYYYGYRYYDPVTGRWPSRDPIEEEGGTNLYGFGPNSAVYGRDYLGNKWQGPDEPIMEGGTKPAWNDPGNELERKRAEEGRQKHLNRNLNNECPEVEPRYGPCSKGRQWTRDSRAGENLFHGGLRCYRYKHFHCCYKWPKPFYSYALGTLVTTGRFQGTYDFGEYVRGDESKKYRHIVLDIIPHIIIGSGYPDNQTTVYNLNSVLDEEDKEEEECLEAR